jgi:ketosteroid isomerase-like protein
MAGADDLDEYLSCFTDDAVWDMAGSVRRGHAEILAGAKERRMNGQQGPGTNTRHVITTLAVHFEDTDTATTDCYFLAYGDTTTSPTVRLMGHYHDTVRQTGGGWKLAHRAITFG